MDMVDTGENDPKIITVPVKDKRWDNVKDLADINPHTLKEIAHFFSTYKQLQKKEVKVGDFVGKAEAEAAFERARTLYQEKK